MFIMFIMLNNITFNIQTFNILTLNFKQKETKKLIEKRY